MDKDIKVRVKITSAAYDTFNGNVNIACTVEAQESGRFDNGTPEGLTVTKGDTGFATMYLDKIPLQEGQESAFQRSMGVLRAAGCPFTPRGPDLNGPFPNAVIGVYDIATGGKRAGQLRCHYLNAPFKAVAKAPPSAAQLAALFGRDPNPVERHSAANGDEPEDSGKHNMGADDSDIPF